MYDSTEQDIIETLADHEIERLTAAIRQAILRKTSIEKDLGDASSYKIIPECQVKVNGKPVEYIHPSDAMKILGSLISGGGISAADMEHRI